MAPHLVPFLAFRIQPNLAAFMYAHISLKLFTAVPNTPYNFQNTKADRILQIHFRIIPLFCLKVVYI